MKSHTAASTTTWTPTPLPRRLSYGIDAPHVIRNLMLAGIGGILVGLAIPEGKSYLITPGLGFLFTSSLMLLYSRVGKYHYRDRILDQVLWKGNEMVLDVGTGRGLLLIGAAKRLRDGKAVGIDIWNTEDLSHNSAEHTLHNAALEGVKEKVIIRSEDIRTLNFPDQTFDIILSNLCLHNIPDRAGRQKAIAEIARVLKPGGSVILSDMQYTRAYAQGLRQAGLQVKRSLPFLFSTFPPLRIVTATRS